MRYLTHARPDASTWRRAVQLSLTCAALLVARSAAAQTYTTPRVRITPTGGNYVAGAQVNATVQYCSRYPFEPGSEHLIFNGTPVSFTGTTVNSGTQSDCPQNHVQFERSNVVLTLGYGSHLFLANIENNPDGLPNNPNGFYRQASASYSTPWPNFGVTLVADDRYVDVRAATSRAERYTITNTGDVSTTFTPTCTWSGSGGCALSPTSVTLAAGATATITATVAVGAAGSTGALAFSVTGGGGPFPAKASALTEITAIAPPTTTRGVTLVNPGGVIERDLCVTIKAGNDAAAECGDLRLAHALPSIRTKGKARTPVLLFNGALAEPMVRIPADLALDTGFVTTSPFTDIISATVYITAPAAYANLSFDAGHWSAADWPSNGEAQRIVASFDGSSLPTGKYSYQLSIQRSSDGMEDVATGTLLHVNRTRSPMHGGWWLAGLEQLVPVDSNQRLWVGGDGSAHLFVPGKFGCPYKLNLTIDKSESLACVSGGGYVRQLANGLRIVFDSSGRHRYTVNRLGDTTEFTYTAQGALASIVVPPRTNGVGAASYTFHYGATSGLLDSVSAPPLSASVPRRVKLAWVTGRPVIGGVSGGRILSITDPDTTVVQLHYANESAAQGDYRVMSRVDRRGTTTTFGYGLGDKLVTASTPASSTQTVAQTLRAAEGQGIGASTGVSGRAIPLDSVFTRLDGPRTDVADVTKWWLNALGAPVRVRDPMGVETKVVYDSTWRGLASITRGPTGLTSLASYNGRALVDSVKAVNPLGTGADGVTRYFWNATWDMPDSTRAPTGEVTSRAYDASGNVLWEQAGHNAARRVTFAYDAATKQLTSARYPGIATPDTVEYDAMRNVSRTTSPGGRWVQHYADALGRDTLVVSPIDATHNTTQRIRFDIADQVLESRTFGPALPYTLAGTGDGSKDTAAVLPETLVVRTAYDKEGNVTRLQKFALPNPRPWINRCDAPRGQCAGIVAEDSGSVDVRTYDWVHRPLTVRLGSSGGTFTYDPAGNVLTRKTWNNRTSTNRYDASNRRVASILPQVLYPREACEGVLYGPFNRANTTCGLRFPFYPNANVVDLLIPADTSRFVFDQAGQLLGAYNTYARIDRRYLPAGALQVDTLRIRGVSGADFNLKYAVTPSYDLSGRRTKVMTPWSVDSIRYAYDGELGVLDTVWQGNARIRFTYDLAGRQDSLFIGSGNSAGVTESRSYDADGMLRKRVRNSATLGNLITDSIAYDLRDKMVDVFTQSRAADVGTLEYHNRYSALGAVLAQQKLKLAANWDLEEFRTTGMGDVYRSRTFHSDGDNGFPTLSTYNQFGALVGRGPQRDLTIPNGSGYQDSTETVVDDAGNVGWTQTYNLGYHTSDPESQSITRSYFGADNTLRFQQRYAVTATAPSPGSPPPPQKGSWEEHWYDALGRKVLTRARRDTLCTPTTNDPCASYVERTVWDGDQVLYELRGLGGNTATTVALNTDVASGLDYGKVGYVHAGGIDAPLVLMDGRVPNYNWRGLPESSVTLTGASADCSIPTGSACTTILWPGNGGVYMKPVPHQETSSGQPTWVGSLLANGVGSTGMAYRRNRFYDGATGQFNQQDPIGLAGGANSYGFVQGDPVNFKDPFGLKREGDNDGSHVGDPASGGKDKTEYVAPDIVTKPRFHLDFTDQNGDLHHFDLTNAKFEKVRDSRSGSKGADAVYQLIHWSQQSSPTGDELMWANRIPIRSTLQRVGPGELVGGFVQNGKARGMYVRTPK